MKPKMRRWNQQTKKSRKIKGKMEAKRERMEQKQKSPEGPPLMLVWNGKQNIIPDGSYFRTEWIYPLTLGTFLGYIPLL